MIKYFILILWVISSCGDSSTSKSDPIIGTWKHGDCQAANLSLLSGYYSKSSVEFSKSTVTMYDVLYSDSACISEIEAVVTATGTYSRPSITSSEINLSWSSIDLTPKSENASSLFKGQSLCGKTDWILDSAQSVKSLTCLGWGRPFASNSQVLQIVEIETRKLWLGNSIYLASSSRPEKWSDRAFEKQ
jgi:hypothetical protein